MSREAIEEAIEVLEDASAEMLTETGDENYYSEAIAILRQALETEQEPVAHVDHRIHGWPDCLVIKADPPDREEIIRMAREAGLAYGSDEKPLNSVTRFAALVAAHEREACAKVCDEQAGGRRALEHYAALTYSGAANDCAEAIRARGQA
jgi:hypothetical protein